MTPATVHAAGIAWRVLAAGPVDGPPLLLLHGFPETADTWDRVAPHLAARGWRVLMPDLPGYGESGALALPPTLPRLADAIVALADALGLGRFVLAGHDWGGLIAWAVAARHPGRVERLIAAAAPHPDVMASFVRRHPGQLRRSAYIAAFQLPRLPELLLRANGARLLRRALVRTARPGAFDPADLARYAAIWQRPGRLQAMLAYYRALRHPRPPLPRVAARTLILWGAQDRFLDARLAAASAQACATAEVAVHPRATHWLHREEPAWLAGATAAFLAH